MQNELLEKIVAELDERLQSEIEAHIGDNDDNFPSVKYRKGYIRALRDAAAIIESEREKDAMR